MIDISNVEEAGKAVTAYLKENSIDFSKEVSVVTIQEGIGEIGDLQMVSSVEELTNLVTSTNEEFKRCIILIDDDPLSIFLIFTENEDKELFSVMKNVVSNN